MSGTARPLSGLGNGSQRTPSSRTSPVQPGSQSHRKRSAPSSAQSPWTHGSSVSAAQSSMSAQVGGAPLHAVGGARARESHFVELSNRGRPRWATPRTLSRQTRAGSRRRSGTSPSMGSGPDCRRPRSQTPASRAPRTERPRRSWRRSTRDCTRTRTFSRLRGRPRPRCTCRDGTAPPRSPSAPQSSRLSRTRADTRTGRKALRGPRTSAVGARRRRAVVDVARSTEPSHDPSRAHVRRGGRQLDEAVVLCVAALITVAAGAEGHFPVPRCEKIRRTPRRRTRPRTPTPPISASSRPPKSSQPSMSAPGVHR